MQQRLRRLDAPTPDDSTVRKVQIGKCIYQDCTCADETFLRLLNSYDNHDRGLFYDKEESEIQSIAIVVSASGMTVRSKHESFDKLTQNMTTSWTEKSRPAKCLLAGIDVPTNHLKLTWRASIRIFSRLVLPISSLEASWKQTAWRAVKMRHINFIHK
jgi:hypothetical protein